MRVKGKLDKLEATLDHLTPAQEWGMQAEAGDPNDQGVASPGPWREGHGKAAVMGAREPVQPKPSRGELTVMRQE